MEEILKEIKRALHELENRVINSWGEERTLCEAFGWNCPALTKRDLALMARQLAEDLERADLSKDVSDEIRDRISRISTHIALIHNSVNQMFNGNANSAVQAYIASMLGFRMVLSPILPDWSKVDDPALMPHRLATRVRSLNARLDRTEPEMNSLDEKVRQINAARDAAESLPADLEALNEARKELEKIALASKQSGDAIVQMRASSGLVSDRINEYQSEADKLISQLKELHRVGTSTALAGAFDARSKSLNRSVYLWVALLVVALGAGAAIGYLRLEILNAALSSDKISWPSFFGHCFVSLMGLGGPVWLGWIATKQIGQRFRLAEDYAYKASISNAYEGYRREAVDLDEEFQARLFGSALTRLDEAPLRLVESDSHGSPLHEFFNSPVFSKALEASDELKTAFIGMLKRRGEREKGSLSSVAPPKSPSKSEDNDSGE